MMVDIKKKVKDSSPIYNQYQLEIILIHHSGQMQVVLLSLPIASVIFKLLAPKISSSLPSSMGDE
jgi:hypothetical protein